MPKTATKVNKSKAIRAYLEKNPNAGPKAIIEAMKKKKIKVTVGLVSNVKTMMKSPAKKKKSTELSLSDLQTAQKLVNALGGVKQAKQAIDALSQFK